MNRTAKDGVWEFALALYGSQGVSEACLLLQDESGVDVPMLLFALWLAAHSVALPEAEMQRIEQLVKAWREEVVRPLRAIRRRLKEGPHPAPSEGTNALRNSIKAAELASERIELDLLEAEGRALISTGSRMADAARHNALVAVKYYRGAEPDDRALAAVNTILAAFTRL